MNEIGIRIILALLLVPNEIILANDSRHESLLLTTIIMKSIGENSGIVISLARNLKVDSNLCRSFPVFSEVRARIECDRRSTLLHAIYESHADILNRMLVRG